ncbi:hypothetical protein ATE47_01120 [Chryseobacterium sp. IHB B 17019]|uniref:hypothetical protein n=1 Tax=Chryseobacterium sp. IHB B 17019 TaxID=1721091 RepID=UPI0007215D1A|nr:hypothetical protein [Chryseobacterium sp. IHB B 17019]ALR29218.1 hypothetical protein ATE47_01120 [Chryseobacterium sp. IHB B 17019]
MEPVTKDDLRQWGMRFMHDMEKMLDQKLKGKTNHEDQEWLRSRTVRHVMDISAAQLINIRIQGKIRYKKIMGSYYYCRTDLLKLFADENKK